MLRSAVYISWFTAAPVYGFAGLRCAVDITLLTPFGLFGLVI